MYQDNSEKGDNETSKFNEAQFEIERLHNHWLMAEHYANTGALFKWNLVLFSVRRELSADINRHSNKEKILAEDNGYIKQIANAIRMGKKNQLYFIIHTRHVFLKQLQDDAGKGGSYEASNSQDFE